MSSAAWPVPPSSKDRYGLEAELASLGTGIQTKGQQHRGTSARETSTITQRHTHTHHHYHQPGTGSFKIPCCCFKPASFFCSSSQISQWGSYVKSWMIHLMFNTYHKIKLPLADWYPVQSHHYYNAILSKSSYSVTYHEFIVKYVQQHKSKNILSQNNNVDKFE